MSKTVHNNGTYFTDGRIASISGVSIVMTRVYLRESPKYFPNRLWWWLADKFTVTVTGEEL
jgi:hypothetical protein